jgi:hypothetical protein
MARVVFEEIGLRDGRLTAVKPQAEYAPLSVVSARPEPVEGQRRD